MRGVSNCIVIKKILICKLKGLNFGQNICAVKVKCFPNVLYGGHMRCTFLQCRTTSGSHDNTCTQLLRSISFHCLG